MCGIAGIVNFHQHNSQLTKELYDMSQAIRHRGPDSEGYLLINAHSVEIAGGPDTPLQIFGSSVNYTPSSGNISGLYQSEYTLGFAHRRLSIIDPTPAGHQPMSDHSQRWWITFNGELYNYLELRAELILSGISFYTNTDTEVILAAYIHWGNQCLQRFNGMFAFVIYDSVDNTLFGCRDRFGVKPFYYTIADNRFCFASEQKALLKTALTSPKINEQAVFEYLVLAKTEVHADGLFVGIKELMPSHCFLLKLATGSLIVERYYTLSYTDEWEPFENIKFQLFSTAIQEKLFNAVTLRLRSDVALGSCLSGGIDSSSLVSITDALARQHFYSQVGAHQQVFTAAYGNHSADESQWAKIVVDNTNTSWHKVYPDPEKFLAQLEKLTWAQDIPILASSTFAQYCVMEIVKKENVKVTLDGQGADELFTGYPAHFISYFYEAAKHLSYREIANSFGNAHPSFSEPQQLLSAAGKNMAAGFFKPLFKNFAFKNLRKEYSYFQADFWQRQKESLELLQPGKILPLNKLLFNQMTGADLKVLLRTGDRNSMHFSVESRVPFADDHPLIEYVFQIPPAYKIRHGQSKSLLREAMKGILPEHVRLRKDKMGFATPQAMWLRQCKNELGAYIDHDLDQYIDSKRLLADWDKLFLTLPAYATNRLYRIIQFAVWKKVFKV